MSDDRDQASIFRSLRDRETPDLDSEHAWARLRAEIRITPQRRGWTQRVFHPLPVAAFAAALLAITVLATWPGPATSPDRGRPDAGEQPAERGRLVLLAEPESGPEAPPSPVDFLASGDAYTLDVRLVRGYTGARPADALEESSRGAGGASLRIDLEPTLRALLPGQEHAIVGAWSGAIEPGDAGTALSAQYRLAFEAAFDAAGVTLSGVELSGEGRPLLADEMRLEPGRLYLFGVRGADAEPSELLLAVRVRVRTEAGDEQD